MMCRPFDYERVRDDWDGGWLSEASKRKGSKFERGQPGELTSTGTTPQQPPPRPFSSPPSHDELIKTTGVRCSYDGCLNCYGPS